TILSSNSLFSQASSYSFAASSGTFTQNSVSATLLPLVAADDYISPAQSIGFTFVYEGINYTQFKMSSNGVISLNTAGTASLSFNDFSSANASSRPILGPLWDDLDGRATGGSVASFEVTGSTPNRVLTVEWRNWEWNYASASPVISFQVKLFETSNVIQYVYRQESGTVNSVSASIGIGSATGSGSGSYLNLDNSSSTPTASSTTSYTTISTKPATGQVYTWTPPTPCTGTPEAGTISGTLIRPTCGGSAPTPATATATGFTTGVSSLVFQWEKSLNNSTWSNAVGTGATTATYTLPNHTAGQIEYYRLKVTCTPSGLFDYSDVVLQVTDPAIPTTQASSVTTSALGPNTATITWTAGSGTRRFVVLSNTNSFTDPVGTGDVTVAGTVYAGSGQQIVYDGAATSVSVTGLTSNTTYYARVYEYLRCTGSPNTNYYNVSLTTNNPGSFTTLTPPANDLCSGALPIACGASLTGSNANAGDDVTPTPTCGLTGTSGSFKGVWFTVTSPLAGPLTVSACGTNYDTYMRVYGGPCGAFTTCMGSNDDFTGCSTASQVTFTAVAGTTYYILLGGYFNTSIGNYTITASCPAACVVPTSSAATNITSTTA
ncbi:MAG: hypothetical protein WAR99_10285, partial [Saprospiraceae bacterium]